MPTAITFEEISRLKSGNATLWHYGEVKVGEAEYPFTLAEMVDNNWSSFEVTWVEQTPENNVEIEQEIIDQYQDEARKEEEE